MKKLTINQPLHRAVLKNFIASTTFIWVSPLVQADTITTSIDLAEPYPFIMEDRVKYYVDVDIGYRFHSIERVCINAEVKGGNASSAHSVVESEFSDPLRRNAQLYPAFLIYDDILPTPENPNPIPQLQDFSICAEGNALLLKNLLDGESEIELGVLAGYVEFWGIELVVEGDVSDIQLAIDIAEPAEFTVPSYGGRVNYDASIRNLDSTQSLVTLEQWSVLKFPNGDNYPIHKSRDVVLNYSETKGYNQNYLNIPAWFEAGDYELTWYVTDPNIGVRVKDSLSFTKSVD
ncbi:hypothetical protein ACJJIE_02750 [Microbulbifer sp. TRSA001]|uniref:RbmA family biofilm matrix protein n=1 Tax=Microbulbifer sp. TRSA001 TaxID=3243381 RepID=UPI004039D787